MKTSCGLLLYHRRNSQTEVLLVHMGGPFWAKKDTGAWSIPKGEVESDESSEAVARREFNEELGAAPPAGQLQPLGEVKQTGGKRVIAYSLEGDFDVDKMVSNTFELEWPPRSGKLIAFPEADRAAWLSLDEARAKIIKAQTDFLDRLTELVN